MDPQLEIWQRETTACPDCGGERVVYSGEAVVKDATVAVFWAFLYDHPGNPEVFIDATFGTWGVDGYSDDHETFGSRTGAVEEHPHVASSLVTGAEVAGDSPLFGVKLTRDEALNHPRLDEFWGVNDAVLALPEVQELMSGRGGRRRWRWKR